MDQKTFEDLTTLLSVNTPQGVTIMGDSILPKLEQTSELKVAYDSWFNAMREVGRWRHKMEILQKKEAFKREIEALEALSV